MNNWQHSYTHSVDLIEHLKKPYFRYDDKKKEATKTVFDSRSNLVWIGDSYGRISSYDPSLSLYTRHAAHIGGMPVKDLLSHREGILSLNEDSLHFANRRGITLLNLTSVDIASFSSLNAMSFGSIEQKDEVYCAGDDLNSGIVTIDLNKGCLSSITNYSSKVKLMCTNNKLISVGKQSGAVDMLDPNSNTFVRSFPAHSGTISGMDSRGYTLVTVGKSRRFNNMYADPFVNIYDLRTMQQLPPISFSKGTIMGAGGADFVQLHPLLPTVMVVASESGAFDFIDLVNPTLRTQYLHPNQSIKEITLSPSGDFLAFVGGDNVLSTWSRSEDASNFTNTPDVWEYPDYVDDGLVRKKISLDDYGFPLSSVGLPYYNQKLLSAWPNVIFRSPGTIPPSIDPNLPVVAKYQINSSVSTSSEIAKSYPLYRYNKMKCGHRNTAQTYVSLRDLRKKAASGFVPEDILRYKSIKEGEVPPAYSKLQLSHGRYGTDNFDFQAFNQTPFSTLDTDGDNVYTNSILQLYRFIPEVFNLVVGCLKDENFGPGSILTELGYLYDMMDRSQGKICRPTNFQTTFNAKAGVKELGLIAQSSENTLDFNGLSIEKSNIPSPEKLQKSLIQKFNEFLLQNLIDEEAQKKTDNVALKELFGLQLESVVRSNCNRYEKVTNIVPTLTVLSPTRNGSKYPIKKVSNLTILPYLESSMRRIKYIARTAEKGTKQEIVGYERTIKNLPPVLSLDILLSEQEWSVVKSVKNWLSKEFYAAISKDKPVILPDIAEFKGRAPTFKYELNGYVARVNTTDGETRLVTYARIFDASVRDFKWYLFNGYLAVEILEEEALDVSPWWKTPECIIYCDAEELRKPFFPVDTYRINYDILYRDHFANGIRQNTKLQYKLLSKEEAPHPGTLVAIDAEFVILNDELSDIDCNGVRKIIKPRQTALARLSAIRCQEGALFGVPFIDDYIFSNEHIEDYVTRYSGICPGDLDLEKSTKQLVSREVTYRKVWLLLQLGCVFVGHGLNNDFKNININVPQSQIRDTAVYFLRGKRYLSLRYLAFALLDKNIQEGNHDSIEDAYTALILYKKYLSLRENGTLEHVLDTIYAEGRALNYRVPL